LTNFRVMYGHLYATFLTNSDSNVILAHFSLSNMEDFGVKRFRDWAK
jgi:hypothetical protein